MFSLKSLFASVHETARRERAAQRKRRQAATEAERERCAHARRRARKIGQPGQLNRSILVDYTRDGLDFAYHATKGWRVQRATA